MPEHEEQVAFFDYVDIMMNSNPDYENIFAIPNAGKRSIGAGSYYRAEGLRAGVPDVFVAVPNAKFPGLFMEFKYKKGKTTEQQEQWLNRLSRVGYACVIVRSSDAAIRVVDKYLRDK